MSKFRKSKSLIVFFSGGVAGYGAIAIILTEPQKPKAD